MTSLTTRMRTRPEVESLLEDAVVSGQLASGDRLPSERDLAKTHGVSRPVIREALRALAERRIVEIFPGRGVFVLQPSLAQGAGPLELLYRRRGATARDLSEARLMLECEAADLAARRADLEDINDLRQKLEALESAGSIIERIRRDLAFHLRIASASHNPVIETMSVSIVRLTAALMLRSVIDPEVRRRSDPYHAAAYTAIEARDPAAAREAIRAHLSVASETYGPDYGGPLEVVAMRGLRPLGYTDIDAFVRDVTTDQTP